MQNDRLNDTSYSIFRVGAAHFAIEAAKVIEILVVPSITPVPKGANYMKGLFNHRGRILSLIDTAVRLNLPATKIGEETPLMVIQYSDGIKELEFGAIVEEVVEVLPLQDEEIQASPSLESVYNDAFIKGIFKYKQWNVTLLDIKKAYDIK